MPCDNARLHFHNGDSTGVFDDGGRFISYELPSMAYNDFLACHGCNIEAFGHQARVLNDEHGLTSDAFSSPPEGAAQNYAGFGTTIAWRSPK